MKIILWIIRILLYGILILFISNDHITKNTEVWLFASYFLIDMSIVQTLEWIKVIRVQKKMVDYFREELDKLTKAFYDDRTRDNRISDDASQVDAHR